MYESSTKSSFFSAFRGAIHDIAGIFRLKDIHRFVIKLLHKCIAKILKCRDVLRGDPRKKWHVPPENLTQNYSKNAYLKLQVEFSVVFCSSRFRATTRVLRITGLYP